MSPNALKMAESPPLLSGLRVGISGTVPEPQHWGAVKDLDRVIMLFISKLSSLVMSLRGEVVHGSDPSVTPVLVQSAIDQQQATSTHEPLTVIGSRLWGNPPDPAAYAARSVNARVLLTPRVGDGDSNDRATRNYSLTALRMMVAQRIDVLIAVGGKLHSDTGFNAGVLEELTQARWSNVPCFVVGALGGIAGSLKHDVIHEFSQGNLMSVSEFTDQVAELARQSLNMDEYVGGLIHHLVKHRDEFLKNEKRAWAPFRIDERAFMEEINEGIRGSIAQIDIDLVKSSSSRFSQLCEALEKADMNQVRQILQSPPQVARLQAS